MKQRRYRVRKQIEVGHDNVMDEFEKKSKLEEKAGEETVAKNTLRRDSGGKQIGEDKKDGNPIEYVAKKCPLIF